MKIGNIELLNVDCMEYMKTVPDKHFDLAIVDPPYGIIEKSNRERIGGNAMAPRKKYHEALWSQKKPDRDYFFELCRVSKNQIIWGGNYFADLLNPSRHWIVWDKVTEDSSFADCELAWTSFSKSIKKFVFAWNGMIQGDMKNKENRIHPTQKPVAIYKWLIKNYAVCPQCKNEGRVIDDDFTKETIPCETCNGSFKILDTHLGSGSIAIACHDYKFELTGCEIDKDYFDAAVKRLQNHVAQTVLF